jgi:hypothetical protein
MPVLRLSTPVGVEKVTEISRAEFSKSMLQGSDPAQNLMLAVITDKTPETGVTG